MEINTYSSWRQSNIALHMLLQMMGKTKLDKMSPRPEWNQSILYLTPNGFTTGMIPDKNGSFEIHLDLLSLRMVAQDVCGAQASFTLNVGDTVSDCYKEFQRILNYVGHPCSISSVPQEVVLITPFENQKDPIDFDNRRAWEYFETCIFARNALLAFSTTFRGKKVQPALFWSTFDMTTVLYCGVERQHQSGSKTEGVITDEVFVALGFWPGDDDQDDPSFYALGYPYVDKQPKGMSSILEDVRFDPKKRIITYPLKWVLRSSDPQSTVIDFCNGAFRVLSRANKWPHSEWFSKPF